MKLETRSLRLFLVDATFELFRAYHAMPGERAANGQEVGAIRGLIRSILALLRQHDVTHIAAATDHVIESFRNELFDGYKTGEGIEPDLLSQFPLAEEALRACGVVVWPMIEFEADDALATAASRFAGAVGQVVIMSPDKDLAQCVKRRRVVTHDRIRRMTYDEQAVQAKFGVRPSCIPDLLALVGDRADGIPGLPGWGKKSAAAILSAYRHIEAIPDDPSLWPITPRNRSRLASTLRERRQEAILFKRLATLRTDVTIQESLGDLRWRGVPRDQYRSFCIRTGLRDLADRPAQWAP